jgi:hypothetical protein
VENGTRISVGFGSVEGRDSSVWEGSSVQGRLSSVEGSETGKKSRIETR